MHTDMKVLVGKSLLCAHANAETSLWHWCICIGDDQHNPPTHQNYNVCCILHRTTMIHGTFRLVYTWSHSLATCQFVGKRMVTWKSDEKCKSLLEQLRQLIKTVGLAKFQVRFSWIIQVLPVWPTLLRCFRVTAQISAREANHRIFPLAVSNTVAQHVSIVSGAPLLPSSLVRARLG